MTKRRKSSSSTGLLLGAIAFLLGLAAFCMCFFDSIVFTEDVKFTGMEMMFGLTENNVEILKFNYLACLAFMLPVLGGIVGLVKNPIAKIVAFVLFAGGAVMLFMLASFFTEEFMGDGFNSVYSFLNFVAGIFGGSVQPTLSTTVYIAGGCAAGGGLLSLGGLAVK